MRPGDDPLQSERANEHEGLALIESRYYYPRSYYRRRQRRLGQRLMGLLLLPLVATGCYPAIGEDIGTSCRQRSLQASNAVSELSLPQQQRGNPLLVPTWITYQQRFVMSDGRVVDREDRDRTVSEGQAYTMLRAAMINDRPTFERALAWAEANLARPGDSLWAWHWGQAETGEWRILDDNFATDADIDAVTALILAARRWNCPAYMDLAKTKLNDIWTLGTAGVSTDQRHLLPGPAEAFWQNGNTLILNPSYFAPYSFKLFAQVDSRHDWLSLVDTGYQFLDDSTAASAAGLPSDWIQLDLQTGEFLPVPDESALETRYSFDAFRVWWRVALDAAWFNEPRAEAFLSNNLAHLQQRWRNDSAIPASLSLDGEALVDYEATVQYAMLYPAFQLTSPLLAREIYLQKLLPAYEQGFWDNNRAYYAQNLAWFGLLPLEQPGDLLQ